jgi:hypothetical protein
MLRISLSNSKIARRVGFDVVKVHSLRISVPWVISFRPSVATIWSMLTFSSKIACRSIWPTGRIRHFAYRAGS